MSHKYFCTHCGRELTQDTVLFDMQYLLTGNAKERFDILSFRLTKAELDGAEITDDCSAVERMGMSVRMVEGDERNIKVTTPMDLKIAQLLLEEMK